MFKRMFAVGLVASAMALSACGSGSSAGGTGAGATTAAVAAAKTESHPALAVVDVALADDSIKLSADQRTKVETIRSQLATSLAPVRSARAALGEVFAKSLEAGAVDSAGIDAAIQNLEAAETAALPAVVKASDDLHAALDGTQRKALVEAMRSKGKAHFAEGGGGRGPMKKMADDLGLTEDQREKFKEAMHARFESKREAGKAEWGAMRDRMKAQADAFIADSYDAKTAGVGEHMAKGAGRFAEHARAMVEIAIPILTPAQRTQLAAKIREKSVI